MHKTSNSRGFTHKQDENNVVKTIASAERKRGGVKPVL